MKRRPKQGFLLIYFSVSVTRDRMKLLVVLVVVVAICHADSVRSRDELGDEEEMFPRAGKHTDKR